jgi:predicted  nucleic acid-binding Zn-ribbon protein
MESTHSGGPIGLDPFGECPNNPTDEKQSGKGVDHEIVVERRMIKYQHVISTLQAENTELKKKLKDVEPSKEELASTNNTLKSVLEETRRDFTKIEETLKKIRNKLHSII